jgi:cell division protein FtsB
MKTQTETRNGERGTRSRNRIKATLETTWNVKQIGMGRYDERATRRFFNQHKHMMQEAGGTFIQALWVAVAVLVFTTTLAIVVAQLFRICALEKQLDGAHVRIDQLTVEVTQVTARVQALESGTTVAPEEGSK